MVERDGIYAVSMAELRSAGFDLAAARPEALSLSRGGQPVAFELVGQGQNRSLRFYGQAPGQDAHSDRSVYWLAQAGADVPAPAAIVARPAAPAGVAPTTVVSATVRVEEQSLYHGADAAGGDLWLWQTLFAPAEIRVPIQAPRAVDGEATLRVRLVSTSSASADPDHHLILSLGGTQVADEKWDGLGPHVITATLPAGVVRPGENMLVIQAPGGTGAPADSSALDWVELTYPRELVLDRDELVFETQAGEFGLAAPGELAALWDISDPAAPVALSGDTRRTGQIRFASDGASRRFIAATTAGLRKPAAVAPVAAGDLRDWPGGADLIVVTVPQFREALQPLVETRREQGLRVAVVDVDQIYDAFGNGQPGPAAIRAFVQHARSQWTSPAPHYLLLAGDASYDPRGYLEGAEHDLVPTQLVRTSYSGWTASDVLYALPDDNADIIAQPGGWPAARTDRRTTGDDGGENAGACARRSGRGMAPRQPGGCR